MRERASPVFRFLPKGMREIERESEGKTRPSSRAETGRANYLHSTYICISALPGGLPTQQLPVFCAVHAVSQSSAIHFQHPEPGVSVSLSHTKSIPRGALEEAVISVSEMRRQKKGDRRIYSGLSCK